MSGTSASEQRTRLRIALQDPTALAADLPTAALLLCIDRLHRITIQYLGQTQFCYSMEELAMRRVILDKTEQPYVVIVLFELEDQLWTAQREFPTLTRRKGMWRLRRFQDSSMS